MVAKAPHIVVSNSEEDMEKSLRNFLQERLKSLSSYHGIINIGLSGGSMPSVMCRVIKSIERFDWRRVRMFMVDERVVPVSHQDSNYEKYIANLPREFHNLILPLPYQENEPINNVAHSYEMLLKKEIMPEQIGSLPRFDLLFLGVGPDGHTCSIFPNERLPKITEFNWVSAVTNSPKPPPNRVTLTMPVLNAAKNVAFIITGDSKARIVKDMVDGVMGIPASQVRPFNNNLWYFVDAEAASLVPQSVRVQFDERPAEE